MDLKTAVREKEPQGKCVEIISVKTLRSEFESYLIRSLLVTRRDRTIYIREFLFVQIR